MTFNFSSICRFFYKIYVLYQLVSLYLYLYMTPMFNYFYQTPEIMKEKCFTNYINKVKIVCKNIGLYDKIIITGDIHLKKTMNLIISNHNSIQDNLILSKILNETFSWNDLRTVSRISRRNIQNRTLELHNMLLVTGDLKHDYKACTDIIEKWKESSDCIQIILFPEGTIFQNIQSELNNSKKKLFKKILKKDDFYQNTLVPNIGIYNMLLTLLKSDIKYIYDLSVVYTIKNKRICGELNILNALYDKDFRIHVRIDEYKIEEVLKDSYWLFKIWDKKDEWIANKLKSY